MSQIARAFVFVSSFSNKCKPILKLIYSKGLDIPVIHLDTRESRDRVKRGVFPISSVPTLVLILDNGTVNIYSKLSKIIDILSQDNQDNEIEEIPPPQETPRQFEMRPLEEISSPQETPKLKPSEETSSPQETPNEYMTRPYGETTKNNQIMELDYSIPEGVSPKELAKQMLSQRESDMKQSFEEI